MLLSLNLREMRKEGRDTTLYLSIATRVYRLPVPAYSENLFLHSMLHLPFSKVHGTCFKNRHSNDCPTNVYLALNLLDRDIVLLYQYSTESRLSMMWKGARILRHNCIKWAIHAFGVQHWINTLYFLLGKHPYCWVYDIINLKLLICISLLILSLSSIAHLSLVSIR